MVVIDAVARLVPGVLGDEESNGRIRFRAQERLLEFGQYTRPREYRGLEVPEVLLSGNHDEIAGGARAKPATNTRAAGRFAGGRSDRRAKINTENERETTEASWLVISPATMSRCAGVTLTVPYESQR